MDNADFFTIMDQNVAVGNNEKRLAFEDLGDSIAFSDVSGCPCHIVDNLRIILNQIDYMKIEIDTFCWSPIQTIKGFFFMFSRGYFKKAFSKYIFRFEMPIAPDKPGIFFNIFDVGVYIHW